MRSVSSILRSCFLAVLLTAGGETAIAGDLHSTYLDPGAVPLVRLLPPPPVQGSAEAEVDAHAVRDAVASRTAADEQRITADRPCTLDQFASVLGPEFTRERMPVTGTLIEHVFEDGERIVLTAKQAIDRARPYTVMPNLDTFGSRSKSASYPSGHGTFGNLAAIVLAELVPQKRSALFARAQVIGENRVRAGTHFPSDLVAGRIAASVIAAALFQDASFKHDLAQAHKEIQQQRPR